MKLMHSIFQRLSSYRGWLRELMDFVVANWSQTPCESWITYTNQKHIYVHTCTQCTCTRSAIYVVKGRGCHAYDYQICMHVEAYRGAHQSRLCMVIFDIHIEKSDWKVSRFIIIRTCQLLIVSSSKYIICNTSGIQVHA